jgi:hypothetical protein
LIPDMGLETLPPQVPEASSVIARDANKPTFLIQRRFSVN